MFSWRVFSKASGVKRTIFVQAFRSRKAVLNAAVYTFAG